MATPNSPCLFFLRSFTAVNAAIMVRLPGSISIYHQLYAPASRNLPRIRSSASRIVTVGASHNNILLKLLFCFSSSAAKNLSI